MFFEDLVVHIVFHKILLILKTINLLNKGYLFSGIFDEEGAAKD